MVNSIDFLFPPAGYLLGSIPFGLLAGFLAGVDIRTKGSGNIGATNAGRVLGWKTGVTVFFLDFLKGAVPTAAALSFHCPIWIAIVAGLASFFGHLFPIWLGFKGGKGVAVGAGVAAVVLPLPFLMSLTTWVFLLLAWRTVSISSMAAALVLGGTALAVPSPFEGDTLYRTIFGLVSSGLVLLKHLGNLKRLLEGTENSLAPSAWMDGLCRVVQVSSLGAWVGIGWFFTFVVGLGLFEGFADLTTIEAGERTWWLPVPALLDRPAPAGLPEPLRKEQGSLIAGQAVSYLFPAYYAFQFWLAFAALASAYAWRHFGGWHRRRIELIGFAFLLVLIGWALQVRISADRGVRNEATRQALVSRSQGDLDRAIAARKEFGQIHGISVLLNLLTLAIATGAMVLSPFSPPFGRTEDAPPAEDEDTTVNLMR